MIQVFVDRFMERKEELREVFFKEHPKSYDDIVSQVFKLVKEDKEYGGPEWDNLHCIDDGSYQGTLLFLCPEDTYQPSKYWYVKVYYGSCSGCDTLQAIQGYDTDTPPDAAQVDQYMDLALHVVQGIKEI